MFYGDRLSIKPGLLVIFLIIGVVTGLAISPYIETPLNPEREVTKTITSITTLTKASPLFSYTLTFQVRGCGPYGWGYDFHIDQEGSASVDSGAGLISFEYSSFPDSPVHTNLTLRQSDFIEINSLLLSANIMSLNESYPIKPAHWDFCHYRLTIITNEGMNTVHWWDEEAAVESTPKTLFEIARYFYDKLPSEHIG